VARQFLISGAFASIYLLWGSTYFAIALGLQSFPPFLLMGLRSLCGGVILVALSGREIVQASPRTWLNAGLCGLLFFVGCHGTLAFAQQSIASGVAAIVLATIPFWIVLIDFLFPAATKPSPVILLALIPGLLGVAIVAWQNIGKGGVSIVRSSGCWEQPCPGRSERCGRGARRTMHRRPCFQECSLRSAAWCCWP